MGSELTEEITSLAGNMDIQVPSELPLPVLFLATGLPLAAVLRCISIGAITG